MNKLEKAIIYATQKHSGQKRKSKNTPYILHPLEALNIASSLTNDEDVLCGVVLHDVIEDTNATIEDIKGQFGDNVYNLIMSDTEDKMRDVPAELSWKTRKQATLNFLENSNKNQQIVCISDKLANLRDIYKDYSETGDKVFERFNVKDKKEHEWYYRGIGDRLTLIKDTSAYKEYIYLLNKVFN